MTTRKANGQTERDLEQAHLDTEAAVLRSQRISYPEIARRMGCAVSTAHDRVKRAIDAVPYEAVEELRRIELESLDEQERRLLAVQETTHYRVDHGKVIELTEGVPMIDTTPIVQTSMAILRIKDMRAKLTGEYAPTKSAITVVTEDAVDAEIRRLSEQVALNEPGDLRSTPGEAPTTR